MKTIKTISLLMLVMVVQTIGLGQPPLGEDPHGHNKKRNEKIQALKVEFISTKLSLTPSEAEKFWPVYNEFNEKIKVLEQKRRKALKASEGKKMTDAEVNALIKMTFDTDQGIIDLKRDYDIRFKKVLPVQKVGLLYKAEQEFRHELLQKMKGAGPPNM